MKVACRRLSHADLSLLDLYAGTFADFDFFVHVDRKTQQLTASESLFERPNVTFAKHRRPVYWAGYSIVETMMALLGQAQSQGPYDYYIFLSEACFPIRSPAQILADLAANATDRIGVMASFPEDEPISQELIFRQALHYNDSLWFNMALKPPTTSQRMLQWCTLKGLAVWRRLLPTPGRLFPHMVKASAWFGLSADSASYLIAYFEHEKQAIERLRRFCFPDETGIQSILANRPERPLPPSTFDIRNHHYGTHFIDWGDGSARSPRSLHIDDLPLLTNSEAWFARKISRTQAPQLVEKLAARVNGEPLSLAAHDSRWKTRNPADWGLS